MRHLQGKKNQAYIHTVYTTVLEYSTVHIYSVYTSTRRYMYIHLNCCKMGIGDPFLTGTAKKKNTIWGHSYWSGGEGTWKNKANVDERQEQSNAAQGTLLARAKKDDPPHLAPPPPLVTTPQLEAESMRPGSSEDWKCCCVVVVFCGRFVDCYRQTGSELLVRSDAGWRWLSCSMQKGETVHKFYPELRIAPAAIGPYITVYIPTSPDWMVYRARKKKKTGYF